MSIDVDVFGEAEGDGKSTAVHSEPRIWARFLAKWFDYQFAQIFTFAAMFIASFLAALMGLPLPPDSFFETPAFVIVFVLLHGLVFVLVEASFISAFGGTPGKALMGISVRSDLGLKLGFLTSLWRSLQALAAGLAFGIPFILILTQIISASRLNSQGRVFWDNPKRIQYITRPVGAWRWAIGIIVYALFRAGEVAMQYAL